MQPSVYRYDETDRGVELYFGECSTLDGLSVCDRSAAIELVRFGATCYRHHSWATADLLPPLATVGELVDFLTAEEAESDDLGLIDFEACIADLGTLGTHDDGECHFVLHTRSSAMAILQAVAPPAHRDLLIHRLTEHPGFYWTCAEDGTLARYGSFDDYLVATQQPDAQRADAT